MKQHEGEYAWDDRRLGRLHLDDAAYWRCESCGEELLPEALVRRMEEQEQRKLEHWLLAQPIEQFVGVEEAAKILGYASRQAVHQNKRIERGLVYWLVHEGRRMYYLPSLRQFVQTGDGRLPLDGADLSVGNESLLAGARHS